MTWFRYFRVGPDKIRVDEVQGPTLHSVTPMDYARFPVTREGDAWTFTHKGEAVLVISKPRLLQSVEEVSFLDFDDNQPEGFWNPEWDLGLGDLAVADNDDF